MSFIPVSPIPRLHRIRTNVWLRSPAPAGTLIPERPVSVLPVPEPSMAPLLTSDTLLVEPSIVSLPIPENLPLEPSLVSASTPETCLVVIPDSVPVLPAPSTPSAEISSSEVLDHFPASAFPPSVPFLLPRSQTAETYITVDTLEMPSSEIEAEVEATSMFEANLSHIPSPQSVPITSHIDWSYISPERLSESVLDGSLGTALDCLVSSVSACSSDDGLSPSSMNVEPPTLTRIETERTETIDFTIPRTPTRSPELASMTPINQIQPLALDVAPRVDSVDDMMDLDRGYSSLSEISDWSVDARPSTPTPLPRPTMVLSPPATPNGPSAGPPQLPDNGRTLTDDSASASTTTSANTSATSSTPLAFPPTPASRVRLTRVSTKNWARTPPTLPRLLSLSSVPPRPVHPLKAATQTQPQPILRKRTAKTVIQRTYLTRNAVRKAAKFGYSTAIGLAGGARYTRLVRSGSNNWERGLESVPGGRVEKEW